MLTFTVQDTSFSSYKQQWIGRHKLIKYNTSLHLNLYNKKDSLNNKGYLPHERLFCYGDSSYYTKLLHDRK